MNEDHAWGKPLVLWAMVVAVLFLLVAGALVLTPGLRAADRADVKIAVFANAGVWPYNTTTVTDDLDYLGYTNYDLYTPANVADLFNDLEPVEGDQPLYGYDILVFSSGVWSGTSDSNYQLFESHKDIVDYAISNEGMGLLAFEVSLMAGYNYKCLPDNLMIETVGPLYYIDWVSSYLNNDLTGYAFDELVLEPNDLSTYTADAPTSDVFRTDSMVGSFWSNGSYPNGYLNGYETFVRGDYHGQQAKITIAKEYGGGRCILSVAEYDYNCGDNPKEYYAQRLPVENMMEWLTPVAPPEMVFEKTSQPPATVTPASVVTFELSAQNNGGSNATGCLMKDGVPEHTSYVGGSTTLNGNPVADAGGSSPLFDPGGMMVCGESDTAGTILPGKRAVATFQVTVDHVDTEFQSVENGATFACNETGELADGCSLGVKRAVLAVEKTCGAAAVSPGDTVGYEINVTNDSDVPSSSTTITDVFSGLVTYVPGSTTLNGEEYPDDGESPLAGGMEIHSPGAAPGVIAPSSLAKVHYEVTVNSNVAEGSSIMNKVGLSADGVEDAYSSVTSAVGPSTASTWYLAEGYTGGSFDTYILIQNPEDTEAEVRVTFMQPDATETVMTCTVEANSRFTVHADDIPEIESAEISTVVESLNGTRLTCERAMYFDYNGLTGGSATVGAISTSSSWYFAEGYTGGSFDTFILVQNPTDQDADVAFTFMKDDGTGTQRGFTVPRCSRRTLRVDDIEGLEASGFSTWVCSTNEVGVVAERAMYFDYNGKRGGHVSVGVPAVSESWFLPEGCTAQEFDTYVLLLNPADEDAEVTATFMKLFGESEEVSLTVPAHSRRTIKVDDVPGCGATDVSTVIRSTNGVGVTAERAMYFDYYGRDGGHASIGVTGEGVYWNCGEREMESATWYLAEGSAAGEFDTYVLLVNPSGSTAKVRVTFMKVYGESVVREYDIAARSRFTIDLRMIEELSGSDVSISIESLNGVGVVPERAMYFDYEGIKGGHDSIGTIGE